MSKQSVVDMRKYDIVIGIDPDTKKSGYAVINTKSGCVQSATDWELAKLFLQKKPLAKNLACLWWWLLKLLILEAIIIGICQGDMLVQLWLPLLVIIQVVTTKPAEQ